jgi:hypothetical protein
VRPLGHATAEDLPLEEDLAATLDALHRAPPSEMSAMRGPTSSHVDDGDHMLRMRRGVVELGADLGGSS